MIAALEAPYAGLPRSPVRPEPEAVLMIEPPPPTITCGPASFVESIVPRTLMRIVSCYAAGSAAAIGRSRVAVRCVAAALLCRMSMEPNASSV